MTTVPHPLEAASDRRSPYAQPLLHSPDARSNRFAILLLFAAAVRPVVDLQGRYEEGGGLNAGGALGLTVLMLLVSYLWRHRLFIPRGWLAPAFAATAVGFSAMVQLPFSRNVPEAAVTTSRWWVGIAPLVALPAMFALRDIKDGDFVRFFQWIALASCAPVALAFLQASGRVAFTYYDVVGGQTIGRVTGGYFQPNSLGRLMVFLAFSASVLYTYRRISGRQYLCVAIVALTTTFASTHRTSIVGLVLVLAGTALIRMTVIGSLMSLRRLTSLIAGATLALLLLYTNPDYQTPQAIDAVSAGFSTVDTNRSDSFMRGRGQRWAGSIEMFQAADLSTKVIGHGYEPIEPHNDLLRMLIVHGVVGVTMYLMLVVAAYRASIRSCRTPPGRWLIRLWFAWFALFSIPLQPTGYPYFMWLFAIGIFTVLAFEHTEEARTRGGEQLT